jgi:peptidoglycan/LPS O-acetylase OafA/YrhL
MAPPKSRILLSIQILRAIAAACVVVDHALIHILAGAPEADQHVAWVIGSFGVAVFFAISGLLMVETSYRFFGAAGGAKTFLRKRIVRIVPIYWLFTSLVVVAMVSGAHVIPITETIMSYLFIPFRGDGGDMRPLLGVGWTLNYEMFFYVLFAIALAAPRRLGLTVLFGLFIGLAAFGATLKSPFDTSDPQTVLEFWTSPLILLFPLGCFIGIARQALASKKRLLKCPVPPAVVACAIVAIGVWLTVASAPDGHIYPMSLARQTLMWGTAGLAVAACALTENPRLNFANRALVLLGDASYSTYLSHTIGIRFIGRAIGFMLPNHSYIAFTILVVAANLIGAAVHKLIEVPMLAQFRSEAQLVRWFRTV